MWLPSTGRAPPATFNFPLHPLQIKRRCILLPGTALFLHISVGQPQPHGLVDDLPILIGRDAPPEAVLNVLMTLGLAIVLGFMAFGLSNDFLCP